MMPTNQQVTLLRKTLLDWRTAGVAALVLITCFRKRLEHAVAETLFLWLTRWYRSNPDSLLKRSRQMPCAPPKSTDAASAPSGELVALMDILACIPPVSSIATVREAVQGFGRLVSPYLRPPAKMLAAVDAGGDCVWCTWPGVSIDSDAAALFLHGGGFVAGHPRDYISPMAEMSKLFNCPVLGPNYRLLPEHTMEEAVQDAVAAYLWMSRRFKSLVVIGDSAGGGLALLLLQQLVKAGTPLPSSAVLMSPWVDTRATNPSISRNVKRDSILNKGIWKICVGLVHSNAAVTDASCNPILGDLAGLPPLMVTVGECEMLLDDALALDAKAREAGVTVELEVQPFVPHCYPLFQSLPEGRDALNRVHAFVTKHCEGFGLARPLPFQ